MLLSNVYYLPSGEEYVRGAILASAQHFERLLRDPLDSFRKPSLKHSWH